MTANPTYYRLDTETVEAVSKEYEDAYWKFEEAKRYDGPTPEDMSAYHASMVSVADRFANAFKSATRHEQRDDTASVTARAGQMLTDVQRIASQLDLARIELESAGLLRKLDEQ